MHAYYKDRESSSPSGDKRSPINNADYTRRPKGLFFCANVINTTGAPPDLSPFGDARLTASIDNLINRSTDRLFFADFYCCSGQPSPQHYVTLVVTKPANFASNNGPGNTNISTWCEQNLLELEMNYDSNLYRQVESFPHGDKVLSTTKQIVAAPDPATNFTTVKATLQQSAKRYNPFFYHNGTHWNVSSKIWVEILYTEDICTDCKTVVTSVSSSMQNAGTVPKNYSCQICN